MEEAQSADYLKNKIHEYKQAAVNVPGSPTFDVWVQQETGSHRFDIMDHSKAISHCFGMLQSVLINRLLI